MAMGLSLYLIQLLRLYLSISKKQHQHHRIETFEHEFEEMFTFYDLEE